MPAPRFSVVEQPNEWTKTIKLSEGLSETERVKLSYWTKYREIAQSTAEFLKVFNPQKPSKDHWTTLRCGTSAYHIALLIDTQHGRTGIEFYVPDDKEIGHKAIGNAVLFERRLGLTATPFDAKKSIGTSLLQGRMQDQRQRRRMARVHITAARMGPSHETNYHRTWSVRVSVPIPVRHYVELYNKADDETRSILPLARIVELFRTQFRFCRVAPAIRG